MLLKFLFIFQLSREKTSLQQNIDALQNTSSDTSSEVHRLSAELQQKQKTYEELVDKSNSIQLNLEKKLHETTQNLAARTIQLEGVKNEMETLTMLKIDRENELTLELSRMEEATAKEKGDLVSENNSLTVAYREEKVRLLKEIDEKLKDSDALRSDLNQSIQNLEMTVDELKKKVEISKNDVRAKEEEFDSKIKVMQSVEMDLKKQIEESNRNESELRNNFNEATKAGVESVEQLTKQLNDKSLNSKELECQLEKLQITYNKVTVEHDEIKVHLLAVENEKEELAKSNMGEKESFLEIKSKLEQQLAEAMSKFQSTEDEQVDLVNRNVELVQQIDKLTKDILESKISKSETNDQFTKVSSEFEAFKLSAETIEKDNNAKLAEYIQKENERSENAKLLESQNVQLKLVIGEKEQEIVTILSALCEAKHDYETLKSEASILKESSQAQINSLQCEGAEHIKTIGLLEDKIDQLTSSVNLSDDLKNELNHKSEEIKSKETNITELSIAVNVLKEQITVKDNDLKRLVDEKEMEGKRSIDVIVSKDEEIKSMHLQSETMKKSLEDKIAEFNDLSIEKSLLETAKNSLVQEVSRLSNQIKEYTDNFVDRTELNNLKEEFSIYEETKENEIANLTKQLHAIEELIKNQSAGVDQLEILERKQKEILYEKTASERREAQLVVENKQLAGKLLQMKV